MLERLRSKLAARRPAPAGAEPLLRPLKLAAIDHAVRELGCRSLLDLGGVWVVDGGYALYAVDELGVERAVICDEDFTPSLRERASRDPRVELVEGNFGRPETAAALRRADAILLFDVLLHQVRPDWDEVLRTYAERTDCFVIAGPWWNGEETVRLVELGREEYFNSVPGGWYHEEIWEKLDEYNPRRGRPWRDCHDIWQWGITEGDLTASLEALGFRLTHRQHGGTWLNLPRFDEIAFVFARGAGG